MPARVKHLLAVIEWKAANLLPEAAMLSGGLDVTRLFRLAPRASVAAVRPQHRAGRDAGFEHQHSALLAATVQEAAAGRSRRGTRIPQVMYRSILPAGWFSSR